MNDVNLRFARRLKRTREALNISQVELASLVGINSSTISRYERALVEKIPGPAVKAIADVLGLDPSWLGGLIEDETPIYAKNIDNHPLKNDNPRENLILEIYRNLNKKGKEITENIMQALSYDPTLHSHMEAAHNFTTIEPKFTAIAAHVDDPENMTEEEQRFLEEDIRRLVSEAEKKEEEDES